ncbi:MAG: UvrB/UvrC motif-containing protein [Oscillospiraceae bacterium]|nr:UvrB/UvrC motif-containing protein [Oscillospiraceae bacterium]
MIAPGTSDENIHTSLQLLQNQLKKAIKEERYEDAAKIRDEIKKLK